MEANNINSGSIYALQMSYTTWMRTQSCTLQVYWYCNGIFNTENRINMMSVCEFIKTFSNVASFMSCWCREKNKIKWLPAVGLGLCCLPNTGCNKVRGC